MKAAHYVFAIACMYSFILFSAVECEQKRMQAPDQFNNEEYITRRQWHEAYKSLKDATSRSRRKTPQVFSTAVNTMDKPNKKVFESAVVEAYEQGHICRSDRWMTPQRFIQIFAVCQSIEAALTKRDDLAATVKE